MSDQAVNCFDCKHFYITWDKHFPHGCRAFGFKTKDMPSSSVRNASGTACLHFEEKKKVSTKRELKR